MAPPWKGFPLGTQPLQLVNWSSIPAWSGEENHWLASWLYKIHYDVNLKWKPPTSMHLCFHIIYFKSQHLIKFAFCYFPKVLSFDDFSSLSGFDLTPHIGFCVSIPSLQYWQVSFFALDTPRLWLTPATGVRSWHWRTQLLGTTVYLTQRSWTSWASENTWSPNGFRSERQRELWIVDCSMRHLCSL